MTDHANRLVAAKVGLVAVSMLGLAFAAVPFYDWFCRVTGFAGTTQRAEGGLGSDVVLDRTILVRFDANVNGALGWKFEPKQDAMRVRIGETGLALYRAENISSRAVTGTATFNVAPNNVGAYFTKIDCFCFEEQLLKPGQSVDMPVVFYVDPRLVDDEEAGDTKVITLSYTFFESVRSSERAPRVLAPIATLAAQPFGLETETN